MTEPAVGDRIGAFRIVGPLGRGGMGVVYRAEHVLTGGVAALKTVRAPSQGKLAGIRREIRTLARIRHPGVVRVLADGIHQGLPWYAMELLEGETLRHHASGLCQHTEPRTTCEAADAPVATAPTQTLALEGATGAPAAAHAQAAGGVLPMLLPLLARLCDALAYLHGEGIVHRDLKPDNILVTAGLRPVVVDFGLVRQMAFAGRESLDVSDETVGTVGYMAPEQIVGTPVDARADLYALGCILYELLVGRPPFVAARASDVMQMHVERAPVPPSLVVPGVPGALESVVMALLEKDPRRRLGHAADVRVVLSDLAGGVAAEPDAPSHRPYLYRSSLVGRDAVMGALGQRLRDAMDGRGGMILVGGEAGAGKTRLTVELASIHRGPRLEVLAGECLPGPSGPAALPLGPLHAPLVAIGDRCRERGSAEALRILGEHGPWLALYEPSLAGLVQAGPPPERLTPAEARHRLFEALVHVLSAAVADVPHLVVLDDLQWADDLTAGFLHHLAATRALAAVPLLLVGTYRSDEMPPWIASLPRVPRVNLAPLTPDSVDEIVADMLAVRPAPPELARFARASSEGNPFFVAEYLRLAVAEGILNRDAAGAWGIAPGAAIEGERLALPGTLHELMVRRLDGLPPEARHLVEAACVLGRELDESILGVVAERGDEEVSELVGALVARQVLEEPETGRCRFVHDQLRRVAYERMAPARRARIHGRAAEALTPRATRRLEEQGIVGHHWEMAGAADRARHCYRVAAGEMDRRYAYQEVERLLRASLALAPSPDSESVRTRQVLAETLLVAFGRTAEAVVEHQRAKEEALAVGDVEGEVRASAGLASTYRVLGRWDEAIQLYESVCQRSSGPGQETRLASALVNLAVLRHLRGNLGEALRLYDEVIDLGSRMSPRRLWIMGVTYRANLHREQGRLAEALEGYLMALDAAQRERHAREVATVSVNLAEYHLELGHLEEADAHVARALDIYRRASNRRGEAYALSVRQVAARLGGRVEEAAAGTEELLARADELGDRHLEASLRRDLAACRLALGAVADARALATDAADMHRELGDLRAEAGDQRVLAEVALAAGDGKEAAGLAGLALQCFVACGHRIEAAIATIVLARATGEAAAGDLEAPLAVARELGVTAQSELGVALRAAGVGLAPA